MELRPYQADLVRRTEEALDSYRRVMMQAPTGGGKTVMFAAMARDWHRQSKRVMLLVHRKELVNQAAMKFFKMGIPYGVIAANYTPQPSQYVQIASVQTAIRRKLPSRMDVIIIDEAHHATASSYRTIVNLYPEARILGVSATPCRADGSGFEKDFDHMVTGPQVSELIEQGYLVAPRVLAAPIRQDMNALKVKAGDYDNAELDALMNNRSMIGGLVDQWKKHADGMRTVTFAVNVEHSKAIVEAFTAAGVAAVHLDGTMDADTRDRIIRGFSTGQYVLMSNVGIVTEGFDVPAIECVQLARPTKSLSLYLQMVGRGLRTLEGKDTAIILDHSNSVFMHGLPQSRRDWTLKGVERKKVARPKQLMCFDRATGRVYEPRELPAELADFDLVEVDYDPERIGALIKESKSAERNGFKPAAAWYRWLKKHSPPTEHEIRIAQQLCKFKPGWVHIQRVIYRYRHPWAGLDTSDLTLYKGYHPYLEATFE